MRLIGILVAGVLTIAAVAQGAYIVKLRREIAALSGRVDELRAERSDDSGDDRSAAAPAYARARSAAWPPFDGPRPTALTAAPRLPGGGAPAPAPAPHPSADNGDPLPLPPAVSSPEAREQLRQFVASTMEQQRDQAREQWTARREDAEKQFRDKVIKELGLNEQEGQKVGDIFGGMQTARRDLFEQVRSGQKSGSDIGTEMAALRDRTQTELRTVLGDDQMKKLQELQRQERTPFRGGPGPGGGGGPLPGGFPGGPGAGQR